MALNILRNLKCNTLLCIRLTRGYWCKFRKPVFLLSYFLLQFGLIGCPNFYLIGQFIPTFSSGLARHSIKSYSYLFKIILPQDHYFYEIGPPR